MACRKASLESVYIYLYHHVQEQTAHCLIRYEWTTANIDAAISRARRQIELLREYRTRLIADVVTGKLDVRETAANLPGGTETRNGQWGM